MKFVFRMIGTLVVIIVLLMAVLCYLDTKGLLVGELGETMTVLRRCGKESWTTVMNFLTDSGIAEDAAGILDQGADYLREGVTPHKTDKPGSNALPEGYATASPVPTISPVPTATPLPTVSPVPTATPQAIVVS